MASTTRHEPSVMKNAIVLARLVMRMVAEEIVKEDNGKSAADLRRRAQLGFPEKPKGGALLHRPEPHFVVFCLSSSRRRKPRARTIPAGPSPASALLRP